MRIRMMLCLYSTLFIAACNGSSDATDEGSDSVLDALKPKILGCEVQNADQQMARAAYTRQCGGQPRDCDPIAGLWVCASYVLGEQAPVRNENPEPYNSFVEAIVPGSCTVRAPTLQAAQDAFAAQCKLPRRDCDPVEDQWYCSSQKLGEYAPKAPVTGNRGHQNLASKPHYRPESQRVRELVEIAAGGEGASAFVLPASEDLNAIPQDPLNPLTAEKIALGRLLFHDTAFALEGRLNDIQTWSCATCHHAAAGFKAGVRQGLGNGGIGFGIAGTERVLAEGFDGNTAADAENFPDFQLLASPSILNAAWQDVMLWNGQFGNSLFGVVNATVDSEHLATPGTAKVVNETGFSGLEVQAIAGSDVHRLRFDDYSPIQINETYELLWQAAYGSQEMDPLEGAGLAIAAYERTVLANQAPFQRWLRGEDSAMTDAQLRGAALFFGSAGCVSCHRGPGLSSDVGAMAESMFMAIGFGDLDANNSSLVGSVDPATRLGRGGFTGKPSDNYKFKIPQLYNLSDASVLGHGGSFNSVRSVIEYKNIAVPQNPDTIDSLDYRFYPLSLTGSEVDDLTVFIEEGLYDPDLARYQPESVPSGACVVVDAGHLIPDGRCPGL